MKITIDNSGKQTHTQTMFDLLSTLPYMVNEDRSIYYVKKDLEPLFNKDKGFLRNIVIEFNDIELIVDAGMLNELQCKVISEQRTVDKFCRHVKFYELSTDIAKPYLTIDEHKSNIRKQEICDDLNARLDMLEGITSLGIYA